MKAGILPREKGVSVGIDITIGDLSRQVPEGKKQLFERPIKEAVEDRFFGVYGSWDYDPGRLSWHNRLPYEQNPWFGSRHKARVPVSVLPLPDVKFKGPSKAVVDFYTSGTDAYFISDKLAALIEELDPGSIDRRRMTIETRDGVVDYNVVMPARLLEAVDVKRTDVLIEDKDLAGQWYRSIQFPDGVVFRDEELAAVHSFSDIDVHGWFWSRELIEAAKAAGIRGLYTLRAGRTTGAGVDNL